MSAEQKKDKRTVEDIQVLVDCICISIVISILPFLVSVLLSVGQLKIFRYQLMLQTCSRVEKALFHIYRHYSIFTGRVKSQEEAETRVIDRVTINQVT